MRIVEAYQPISHGIIDNRNSSSENKNGLNVIEREAPMVMKDTMKPVVT